MRGPPTRSNQFPSENLSLKKEKPRSFLSNSPQPHIKKHTNTPTKSLDKNQINTPTEDKKHTNIKPNTQFHPKISKISHTNIQKNTQTDRKIYINTRAYKQNNQAIKDISNTHTHTQTTPPLTTLSTHTYTQTQYIRRSNADANIQTDKETNREIQKDIGAKKQSQTSVSNDTGKQIKKYSQPHNSTTHTASQQTDEHTNENNGANTHTNEQTKENIIIPSSIQTNLQLRKSTTGYAELQRDTFNNKIINKDKNTHTNIETNINTDKETIAHTNEDTNTHINRHLHKHVDSRMTSNLEESFQTKISDTSLDVRAKKDLERQRLELKQELTKLVLNRSNEPPSKPTWKQKLKERRRDLILIDLHKKITMIADKHINIHTNNNTNMLTNRYETTRTKNLPTNHTNKDIYEYRDIYVKSPRNIHTYTNTHQMPHTKIYTSPTRASHTNKHKKQHKDTNLVRHLDGHRAVNSISLPYLSSDDSLSLKVKRTTSLIHNADDGYGENDDGGSANSANSNNEEINDGGGLKFNYGGKRYNSLVINKSYYGDGGGGGGWSVDKNFGRKNPQHNREKDHEKDLFKKIMVKKSVSSFSILKNLDSGRNLPFNSIGQLKDSENEDKDGDAKTKFDDQLEFREKVQTNMLSTSLSISSSYRKGMMRKNKKLYETFQQKSPFFFKAPSSTTFKSNTEPSKHRLSSLPPPPHHSPHYPVPSPFPLSYPVSSLSSSSTTDQDDKNSQKIFCLRPGCKGHVSSQDDIKPNKNLKLQDVLDYLKNKSDVKTNNVEWSLPSSKSSPFNDESEDSEKENKISFKTGTQLNNKNKPQTKKIKSILKQDKAFPRNETSYRTKSKSLISNSTLDSTTVESKTSSQDYKTFSDFLDINKTSENISNQNSKFSRSNMKNCSQFSSYSPLLCFSNSTNNNSFASFCNLETSVRNHSLPRSYPSSPKQSERFSSSRSEFNLESTTNDNSCYKVGRQALKHICHVNRDIGICNTAMEDIRKKIMNEVANHFKKKNNKNNNINNRNNNESVLMSLENNKNNNKDKKTNRMNNKNNNENNTQNKQNSYNITSSSGFRRNSCKGNGCLGGKLNINSNRSSSCNNGCKKKENEDSAKNASNFGGDMNARDQKNRNLIENNCLKIHGINIIEKDPKIINNMVVKNMNNENDFILGNRLNSNCLKKAKNNDGNIQKKTWMKEKLFQKIKKKIDLSPKIMKNITDKLAREDQTNQVLSSLQFCSFKNENLFTKIQPEKINHTKLPNVKTTTNNKTTKNSVGIIDNSNSNNTKKQNINTEKYSNTNNNTTTYKYNTDKYNINNNTYKRHHKSFSFREGHTYESLRRNAKPFYSPNTKERVIANCEINSKVFRGSCCKDNLALKKRQNLDTQSVRLEILKKRLDCTKYKQNYEEKYKQFDKEIDRNIIKNTENHHPTLKKEPIIPNPPNSPTNYKTNRKNTYTLEKGINSFVHNRTKETSQNSTMYLSSRGGSSRKRSTLFKGAENNPKKADSCEGKDKKYEIKLKKFPDDKQKDKTLTTKIQSNNNTPIRKTRASKEHTNIKSPREINHAYNSLDTSGWQDKIEYWKVPSDFNYNTHHVRPSPMRSNIFERMHRIDDVVDDDEDDDSSYDDSTTESDDESSDDSKVSWRKWWGCARQKAKKYQNQINPYKKSSLKLNRKPEILKTHKATLNEKLKNPQKKLPKKNKGWLYSTPKYYYDFYNPCYRNNNLNNCPNDTLNKNHNTNPNNNPLLNTNRNFKSAKTKPPWKPSGKYQDPISNFKAFQPNQNPVCNFNSYNSCEKYPIEDICAANIEKYMTEDCGLSIVGENVENQPQNDFSLQPQVQQTITSQQEPLLTTQQQQILTTTQPQILATPQQQLTTPQQTIEPINFCNYFAYPNQNYANNLQSSYKQQYNSNNYYSCCTTLPVVNNGYDGNNMMVENVDKPQEDFEFMKKLQLNCCLNKYKGKMPENIEMSLNENEQKLDELKEKIKKRALENEKNNMSCCLEKNIEDSCQGKDRKSKEKDLKSWWVDFKEKFEKNASSCQICNFDKRSAQKKRKRAEKMKEKEMKKQCEMCYRKRLKSLDKGEKGYSTQDLYKKRYNSINSDFVDFKKCSEIIKMRNRCENMEDNIRKEENMSENDCKPNNDVSDLIKNSLINDSKCDKSSNPLMNTSNIEKSNNVLNKKSKSGELSNCENLLRQNSKCEKSSNALSKNSKFEKSSNVMSKNSEAINCEDVLKKLCGNGGNEVSDRMKSNEEPNENSSMMKKILVEQEVQMTLSTLNQECQTENHAKISKKDETSFENNIDAYKVGSGDKEINRIGDKTSENRKQSLFEQAKNCLKKFKSFKCKSSFNLACSCCNNFEGDKNKLKSYGRASDKDNTLANKMQDKNEKLSLEDELKKIGCRKCHELGVKESFNNQNNKECVDFKAYVRKLKSKRGDNDDECDRNKRFLDIMEKVRKQALVKFSDSEVCVSDRKNSGSRDCSPSGEINGSRDCSPSGERNRSRDCSQSRKRTLAKMSKTREKDNILKKKSGKMKEICDELRNLMKIRKSSNDKNRKSHKQAGTSRSSNKYKLSLADFGLREADCICLKIAQKKEEKKQEKMQKRSDSCLSRSSKKKDKNYKLSPEYFGLEKSDCKAESSKKSSKRSKNRKTPLRQSRTKKDCLEEKKKDAVQKFELFRKLKKVDRTMKQFEKKMAMMKDLKNMCEFEKKEIKEAKSNEEAFCKQLLKDLENCEKVASEDECDMIISSLKSTSKETEDCDKKSEDDCAKICKSPRGNDNEDDEACEKITKLIEKAKKENSRRKEEQIEKEKVKCPKQDPTIFDKLDCLIHRGKSEKRKSWKKEGCAEKKANFTNSKPDWLQKKLDEICGELKKNKEPKKNNSSCEICKILNEKKKDPCLSLNVEKKDSCLKQREACEDKKKDPFLDDEMFDFLNDKKKDSCEFLNAKKKDPCEFLNAKKKDSCDFLKTKKKDSCDFLNNKKKFSFSDLCPPKKKSSSLSFCLPKNKKSNNFCSMDSSNSTFSNSRNQPKKPSRNTTYKTKKSKCHNLLKPSKPREALSNVEKYLTAYSSTSRESLTSCLRQMMMRENIEGVIKELCEKRDKRC